MLGMLSRAFVPRTEGSTGTLRQPSNSRFSSFKTFSNVSIAFWHFVSDCGKKNIPIPYSRFPPMEIPSLTTAFEK